MTWGAIEKGGALLESTLEAVYYSDKSESSTSLACEKNNEEHIYIFPYSMKSYNGKLVKMVS